MTTFRSYLAGLLLLFGAYVAYEYYKPKPLDWSPTLSSEDKIPYGTYALYEVLPHVLGTGSVRSVRQPIFNQLLGNDEPDFDGDSAHHVADSLARRRAEALPLVRTAGTYVFVNRSFNSSELETNALLRFIGRGNSVFIAAEHFWGGGTSLADSLGFGTVEADSTLAYTLGGRLASKDSVTIHLLGPTGAAPTTFRFSKPVTNYRLALYDNHPHCGATLAADAQGRPVLMRLDVGRGHLYVCSIPLALGNYWVLRPRQGNFAFAALSGLPTGPPVWWDEYQKKGRAGEQSLLRVLLGNAGLRQAYYLVLGLGVLLIFGAARRRQRVIPTLRPLPNTTLLFTRTVAGLYRQGRNHSQIAEKKTALFLDYLRLRFQENAPDLGSAAFRERLSQKSGVPLPRVEALLRRVNFARTAPVVTDRELVSLSQAIHDFKREAR